MLADEWETEEHLHHSLYLNLSFRTRISANVWARTSSETAPLPFSTDMALSNASSPVRRNGLYDFSSNNVEGHWKTEQGIRESAKKCVNKAKENFWQRGQKRSEWNPIGVRSSSLLSLHTTAVLLHMNTCMDPCTCSHWAGDTLTCCTAWPLDGLCGISKCWPSTVDSTQSSKFFRCFHSPCKVFLFFFPEPTSVSPTKTSRVKTSLKNPACVLFRTSILASSEKQNWTAVAPTWSAAFSGSTLAANSRLSCAYSWPDNRLDSVSNTPTFWSIAVLSNKE